MKIGDLIMGQGLLGMITKQENDTCYVVWLWEDNIKERTGISFKIDGREVKYNKGFLRSFRENYLSYRQANP